MRPRLGFQIATIVIALGTFAAPAAAQGFFDWFSQRQDDRYVRQNPYYGQRQGPGPRQESSGRQQRLNDDTQAVPTPLWVALIFVGCVVVALQLAMADPRNTGRRFRLGIGRRRAEQVGDLEQYRRRRGAAGAARHRRAVRPSGPDRDRHLRIVTDRPGVAETV